MPQTSPLALFVPPYRSLDPIDPGAPELLTRSRSDGTALIWRVSSPLDGEVFEAVRARPGGMTLIAVLPSADMLESTDELLHLVEMTRPASVLPHHRRHDPSDLRTVLRRPPSDLSMEVGDYLGWRGIMIDLETRRIVRRIVELSREIRTVSALARSLYLSRRALGRRFLTRGLPVPSHWLQLARLLHATVKLQNGKDSLFGVAVGLGYPDGFSMSNQMKRLTGVRPSEARDKLGWEWLFEAWLVKEAEEGTMGEWARLFVPQSTDPAGETEEEGRAGEAAPPSSPDGQGRAPISSSRSRAVSRASRVS